MLLSDARLLSAKDRLLYWIREREKVRLLKESGAPPPWTDDLILQKYRFCNVRRMDDRVSRWLLDNWYVSYKDHPNILVACALARFFNLPSTLEEVTCLMFLQDEPEWDLIAERVRAIKASGCTVFNAAYIVTGAGGGKDKIDNVILQFCKPLYLDPPEIDTTSMQETWERLMPHAGFGSFSAGQVIADLRWAVSGTWEDRNRWAPLGPGSKRGLNILYGYPANTHHPLKEFRQMMDRMVEYLYDNLPTDISSRCEAMDYQNCLCEIAKYTSALLGIGRPKELYRGPGVKYA